MKKYQDHYFKKAKLESYPARSVYKLQEMDKKFGLFKKGAWVLDLGAAPGSWSLYAAQKIGKQGRVLAVDQNELQINIPEQVSFYKIDLLQSEQEILDLLKAWPGFDLAISDLAPKTTGIKLRDQALSLELVQIAFELSKRVLKPGGIFIAKAFASQDQQDYAKELKSYFEKVKNFKPKSSRAESKELFLIGFGYKQGS